MQHHRKSPAPPRETDTPLGDHINIANEHAILPGTFTFKNISHRCNPHMCEVDFLMVAYYSIITDSETLEII